MASKSRRRVKRALLGFAMGALQGAADFARTKAMQEAEALKEQRLAAIRAEERQQNQEFQLGLLEKQGEQQAARDQRIAEQQAARDTAQGEQRMRELELSGKNQREVAGMYASRASEPQQDQRVIVREPSGKLRSVSLMSDEFAQGLPDGTEVVEGRAGTRFSALPGERAGAAPTRAAPAPAAPPASAASAPAASVRPMVWDQNLGRYVVSGK